MMMLDEVIIGIKEQMGLGDPILIDALHYLRQYQEVTNTLHKHGIGSIWGITLPNPERVEGKLDIDGSVNQPLTWEELKQIEGKPVWVELPKSSRKAWGLNDGIFLDALLGHETVTIKVLHDLWHLDKAQMGKTWQAYRKERE